MKKFISLALVAALVATSAFAAFSGEASVSFGYDTTSKVWGFANGKSLSVSVDIASEAAEKVAEGDIYAGIKASMEVGIKPNHGDKAIYNDGPASDLGIWAKVSEAYVTNGEWKVSILGSVGAPDYAKSAIDFSYSQAKDAFGVAYGPYAVATAWSYKLPTVAQAGVTATYKDWTVSAGFASAKTTPDNVNEAEYYYSFVGYDEDGNVKVGYVGAYPYAEVVSGYTAFFLGIQSVFPNVVMDVQYTNSWFDIDGEAAAADMLIKRGCVIIGQHADSTGAPDTVEKAWQNGQVVYSVGYNMSMLDVAPDAALTSATNVWSAYYKELFSDVLNGKEIPQDWSKGFNDDAVAITDLGPNVAEGTADKVAEVEAALKDGSLHVFDTSKFTVNGKQITEDDAKVDLSYVDYSTNTVVYKGDTKTALVTDDDGNSYFEESVLRAAPYFTLRIDGITELNAN